MADSEPWRHIPVPELVKVTFYLAVAGSACNVALILILSDWRLGELAFASANAALALCGIRVWRLTAQSVVFSQNSLTIYRKDGPLQIPWHRITDITISRWSVPLSGTILVRVETFSRRTGKYRGHPFILWISPGSLVDQDRIDSLITAIRNRASESHRTIESSQI